MKEVIVNTQAEYDALPQFFPDYTVIIIKETAGRSITVTARGNSTVTARGCVAVHLQSDFASILLFAFSVCFILAKGKVTKKSRTATIIKPKFRKGVNGWIDSHGIEDEKNVVLFKRVSADFKTQEGTSHETVWTDMHAWENPSYSHKIAFRKGKVLYECDRNGKEIKRAAEVTT